jgi:transketolase C-terminal domain/subunit
MTVEEHICSGGFGSLVLECLVSISPTRKVQILGIDSLLNDVCGDQEFLRMSYGLDAGNISLKYREFLETAIK